MSLIGGEMNGRTHFVRENKSILIQLAHTDGKKPRAASRLGKALANYTNPRLTTYDAEFHQKIKDLRPEWAPRVHERVARKKELLITFARLGFQRPAMRSDLGIGLRAYTAPSHPSYDFEFTSMLRRLAPTWFYKNRSRPKYLGTLKDLAPIPKGHEGDVWQFLTGHFIIFENGDWRPLDLTLGELK